MIGHGFENLVHVQGDTMGGRMPDWLMTGYKAKEPVFCVLRQVTSIFHLQALWSVLCLFHHLLQCRAPCTRVRRCTGIMTVESPHCFVMTALDATADLEATGFVMTNFLLAFAGPCKFRGLHWGITTVLSPTFFTCTGTGSFSLWHMRWACVTCSKLSPDRAHHQQN